MAASTTPVSPSFIWHPSNRSITIETRQDVLRSLSDEMSEAATESPAREVGGLLLGHVVEGDARRVVIEQRKPLPVEYGFGPYYSLSSADQETLAQEIAAGPGLHGLQVVGLYRSHLRAGSTLTDEDVSLMRQYFGQPGRVFLLAHPGGDPSQAPTGAFFFWENGGIRRDPEYREFPLVRPPALAVPLPAVATAPVLHEPETEVLPPPRKHSWQWWIWGTLLAAVTVGAAIFGFRQLFKVPARDTVVSKPIQPPAAVPLGLKIERRDDQLELLWNRDLPVIQAAQRGTVAITDGGHISYVSLYADQLRRGELYYTPSSNDVGFEMQVYGPDGQGAGDTVRMISSPATEEHNAEAAPPNPPDAKPQQPSENSHTHVQALGPLPHAQPGEKSVVVHGVISRDTPVEVRVPVTPPPYPRRVIVKRHKHGFRHTMSEIGGHLWPFRK